MSLIVQNLTKLYGRQKAIDAISFSAHQSEIVGFLGPNGAGKSTTLKIATGYLSPTSGVVNVSGFDVAAHPLEVKKRIGYLPEHNPLYVDMYVHEYLKFVGGIYGLKGKYLYNRVTEMIELCGLTREQNKKIEALSKGYRQRVGLAQALIHDPGVLILDEPTTGLDPNQIIEIRKVIRDISANKTVIFSTHIMQEVQALCNRVIVINLGKIVADDKLSTLLSGTSDKVSVLVEFEREVSSELLLTLNEVTRVDALGGFRYRIIAGKGVDIRPEIFRFAADRNLSLVGLKQEENSLENLFRDLTIP